MTEEQPAEFTWDDFEKLADVLMETDSEAAYRSAVSRYYYAIFNMAIDVLKVHCPALASNRGTDSHKATWDAVAALRQGNARKLADTGRSLRSKRTDADYHREVSGDWRARAGLVRTETKRCVQRLREFLEMPPGRL